MLKYVAYIIGGRSCSGLGIVTEGPFDSADTTCGGVKIGGDMNVLIYLYSIRLYFSVGDMCQSSKVCMAVMS